MGQRAHPLVKVYSYNFQRVAFGVRGRKYLISLIVNNNLQVENNLFY